MNIKTRDFGIIDIKPDCLYDFPQGVYGFEDDTQFAIFEKSFDGMSFLYLQSVQNVIPCFLVFDPLAFLTDFDPIVSKDDLVVCRAESPKDLIFLVIATVPPSVEKMSVNMKSPIVLNPRTKTAKQIILQNAGYEVKYQPFLNTEREAPHVGYK